MISFDYKIKDRNWTITFGDPTEINNPNLDDQDEGVSLVSGNIYISTRVRVKRIFNVIIHELVHAYVWSYGFDYIDWTEENVAAFNAVYIKDILEDANYIYGKYLSQKS